jgi:hypothetical protein
LTLSRYPKLGLVSAVTFALAALLAGCAAETAAPGRTSAPADRDAGADAGDPDVVAVTPDDDEGRDNEAASCFAACQNTSFSCQAKAEGQSTAVGTADLMPEGGGCAGTLTTEGDEAFELELDCSLRTVCVGSAPGEPATVCVSGMFSAFSFAYAPSAGGATNICTRN